MGFKSIVTIFLPMLYTCFAFDKASIDHLMESIPSLEQYQANLYGKNAPKTSQIDPEYADQLLNEFRFANLKNTPTKEILENGGINMDLTSLSDMNLDGILDLIERDRDLRQKMFYDVVAERKARAMDIEDIGDIEAGVDDIRDLLPWLGGNREIGDESYEECYKDYSALAMYRTTRIAERVLRGQLTELLADIDDQTQFCDTACAGICDFLFDAPPTINVCINQCDPVCMGANFTRDSELDAIVDLFIPQVEQQSWGRKMVDSMAKIPSGLTDANLMWTGAYYMCINIEDSYNYTWTNTSLRPNASYSSEPEERPIVGKYCRLPFQPQAFENSSLLYLYFGACVPSTCSQEHIVRYIYNDNLVLKILLENILNWKITTEKIFCDHELDFSNDPSCQAAVGIILTLIIIAVLATLYDVYVRVPTISEKLEAEAEQLQQEHLKQRKAFSNPAYQSLEPSRHSKDLPGGYHHVDDTDYSSYARLGNLNSNNNKVREGNENNSNNDATHSNRNNSNARPELKHSISTSSTAPLYMQSLSYEESSFQLSDETPSIMNRLEVAFVGFSAYNNMRQIFQINRPEGYIAVIDFMRFVSFLWLIFGHTWLFGPLYNESWVCGNLVSALYYFPRQFAFQPIMNFHLVGDTFFVISGLLTVYYWLRRYDHGREDLTWKGILGFYFYRYWKLMAAMMMVLMTYAACYKYLSGGPLAPYLVGDAENCKTNWWTNLLMISNLVNTDDLCLTWVWYVPCVFQLHIIAPLILVPLLIFPLAGYGVLILFYVIHISVTAAVSADIYDSGETARWFTEYLIVPWCRAGPYFIGMGLGIFLYEKRLKVNMSGWVKFICGLLALFFLFAPAYGTFSKYKNGVLNTDWSRGEQVMWDTFARSTWSLGVCWFILVASTGNAGYLGDWMNHTMNQPFARMVYPTFLFHSLLVFGQAYAQQNVVIVDWSRMLQMGLSNACVCLFVGVIFVSLLFHYPLGIGLAKACTVRTKRECLEAGNHPPLPEQSQLFGDVFVAPQQPETYRNVYDTINVNGSAAKDSPAIARSTTKF